MLPSLSGSVEAVLDTPSGNGIGTRGEVQDAVRRDRDRHVQLGIVSVLMTLYFKRPD